MLFRSAWFRLVDGREADPVALLMVLDALPPVDRMIVLLREMEGLSTREVAEITTLSEDNVKTRLHRARARLRDLLQEA